jgi:hypothetical protein
MLHVHSDAAPLHRDGVTRRAVLRAGLLGAAGLSLTDALTSRARASSRDGRPRARSAILVWLDGGPSHLESYDPKPSAPREYGGPFGVVRTAVTGMIFSELMACQAPLARHLSVVRSMHHNTGDHFAGGHWMLTGRAGSTAANLPQMYPSIGSYVSRLRGPNVRGFPAYVGLPAAQSIYLFPGYQGSAYLGRAYNPFDADRERSYLHHTSRVAPRVPRSLTAGPGVQPERLRDRGDLMHRLDAARRRAEQSSAAQQGLGRLQQQALSMVLSPAVARAFDVSREDPRLIDRYGDNPWGRYTLLARRLVESGVTFVTVDMPHWDHHSSLVAGHAPNMRAMDRAVGALIGDLNDRGLLDETLVVVMGEFGRTPRINTGQPGIPIPGRDHWGQVFSVMLAGGGVRGGQVVGSSDARGEAPRDRAVRPHDLFATLYALLGIDPDTTFEDATGRPVPVLGEGRVIRELVG